MKKLLSAAVVTLIAGCSSLEDDTYDACYPLMRDDIYDVKQTGFDEGIIEFRTIHKRGAAVSTTYCAINKDLGIAAKANKANLIIFIKYGTLYGETVTEEYVKKYPILCRKI